MATRAREVAPADAARAEVEAWAAAQADKTLLRFLTCGSVDDGKSTLIGRLLYDSKLLLDDQLAELERPGGEIDFAGLVDGLAAEREQGITIDVAYRFFATSRRKFIVADTPGHEQYTRNMVTGASTADLAIILIDARKGVLTQTKRHSFLVRLLGIRQIVLAVNKMDLVGHDEGRFREIVADYRAFAREAGIGDFTAIPVSGLAGDNIAARSAAMPWHDGPALLEHLEAVPVAARHGPEPFRMAVQWVNRPNQDFRGYAGRIAAGKVRPGDAVALLPSGRRSSVARIVTFDGDLDEAVAGQSVTLTLADELDCSRGDVIAAAEAPPTVASRIEAQLVWMAEEPMVPHRAYWLKTGAQTVSATIAGIGPVIDVNTLEERRALGLGLNDIGRVTVELDRPVAAERYAVGRELGGFILIDKLTNGTVAAGMVLELGQAPAARPQEEEILWIAGESAAARDAAAARLMRRLRDSGRPAVLIGEAELRTGLNGDVENDPAEQARRAREVALLVARSGVPALVTLAVPPGEARPGRIVDAAAPEPEPGADWII